MRTFLGEEYDEFTGFTTRYWHQDNGDGKTQLVIQRLQDVEANLNANQREYNSYGDYNRYGDKAQHKVASIPNAVAEKWLREEGFNIFTATDAEIRRKLNDSDYKKLRTMPGRL